MLLETLFAESPNLDLGIHAHVCKAPNDCFSQEWQSLSHLKKGIIFIGKVIIDTQLKKVIQKVISYGHSEKESR